MSQSNQNHGTATAAEAWTSSPKLKPTAGPVADSTTRPEALWTMIGTAGILATFAWLNNGFSPALNSVGDFIAGKAMSIERFQQLDSTAFAYMAAITVMILVAMFPIGALVIKIAGKPRKPSRVSVSSDVRKPMYAVIMVTLFLEELFARQLFLGWLGTVFTGTLATYALFFIGNSLWALVHLYNYPDKRDRQVVRVLPQFLGGIPLTVVFLQYGFLAALLVHIAYDMLLFCMHKRNVFNIGEKLVIAYNLVQLAIGSMLFAIWGSSPLEIFGVFHFNGGYAIPEWGFWQYVVALMMAQSILTILSDLLVYDYVRPKEMYGPIVLAFASMLAVGIYTLTYWISGFTGWDSATRLIVVAMVIILGHMTHSGSALARAFWFTTPMVIMIIGVMLALDNTFLMIVALAVLTIIEIPEQYFRHIDHT